MNKMMVKDIRHLVLMEGDQCIGMISIKDLTKQVVKGNNETIARLSDFALGKGAFFGSE
jgi:signal-transduction protein with cAMP-binding, CBS, and nucleotidyltransferase domain